MDGWTQVKKRFVKWKVSFDHPEQYQQLLADGTNSAWSRVNKLKLVKNAHEFIMISGDPYLGGQGSLSFIFEPLLLLLTYIYFSQIENDLQSSDRFKLWDGVGEIEF